MSALKVFLVDDEPLARARLRTLLADCVQPVAEVVGEAGQAAELWQALAQMRSEMRPDVLLMDVQMPGLDGVALAQRLRTAGLRLALVFVTAHAQHALAAFEVEAVDYLTKPVRRARLQEALQRAAAWLGRAAEPARDTAARTTARTAARVADEPVIVVHQHGEVLRIPVAEVLYLKAEQKYVQLRTATGSHWLDDSLTELAERLGERFIRVHRNAVVARSAVRRLARAPAVEGNTEEADQWSVCVAPVDEWLAVSRRQLAAVREELGRDGVG